MNKFTGPELCVKSAVEAVELLTKGEVSPTEMLEASMTRIAAVEPAINALPTTCSDRARAAIGALSRGEDSVWLGGLPLAIKDLTEVSGVRCTYGTPSKADYVPEASDPMVEKLERRGGVVVAKSNTPEMGIGANTFNPVLGTTRNPWNTALNAAGSSGGAAAALATGEVWLANGSDVAGSLRTPAAYCGIVGMRPSPGVACGAGPDNAFSGVGVQGPMARTAEDCALFLDALAGFDPRYPISWPAPETSYLEQTRRAEPPARIAYAPDLNGFAPVEAEVRDLIAAAMKRLEGLGTRVEEACPDISGLDDAFRIYRGLFQLAGPGQAPEEAQAQYKRTLRVNIAYGRALDAQRIAEGERMRSRLYERVEQFLRDHEAIACPVVGLASKPVEIEYPTSVDGQRCADYLSWLSFAFLATTLGLPAISVPIGFTANGAPMGIQFIGRPRGEAGLLRIAKVMESVTEGFGRPIDPIIAG